LFDKFEDFNKIIDKPASLELKRRFKKLEGRSPRGHSRGKMLEEGSLREIIIVRSFENLACITYIEVISYFK
jgi:hypothetical protein